MSTVITKLEQFQKIALNVGCSINYIYQVQRGIYSYLDLELVNKIQSEFDAIHISYVKNELISNAEMADVDVFNLPEPGKKIDAAFLAGIFKVSELRVHIAIADLVRFRKTYDRSTMKSVFRKKLVDYIELYDIDPIGLIIEKNSRNKLRTKLVDIDAAASVSNGTAFQVLRSSNMNFSTELMTKIYDVAEELHYFEQNNDITSADVAKQCNVTPSTVCAVLKSCSDWVFGSRDGFKPISRISIDTQVRILKKAIAMRYINEYHFTSVHEYGNEVLWRTITVR